MTGRTLKSLGLVGLALMGSTAMAQDVPVKATMIIYLDPSVQFFNPVVKGAQDAAAAFDVDLDVQYANNDPVRQNDLIESATAAGVGGIAVAISSSDAFDASICAAVEKGITVIGFNNDDLEGAKGNCRQAYVGMDEEASGYELGQRMVKEFGLKEGDVVFKPREIPEATFAVARGGGIERAMGEHGIKVETVRAGLDLAEAQNIMTQFLIANAVKSGEMHAAMDQQPYLQGYYPIAQIAMAARQGLTPTDVDTGQGAFLDQSRIGEIMPLIGTYR